MKFRFLGIVIILSLLTPQMVFGMVSMSTESADFWYSDIDEHNVHQEAIEYMTEKGAVEGYEDDTFAPDAEVNRVEALKIILSFKSDELEKIEGKDQPEFADISANDWFYEYVKEGYSYGLIDGYDDGYFRPEEAVNRAEALKMFSLALDLTLPDEGTETWYDKYINFGRARSIIIPISDTHSTPLEDGRIEWVTEWDYLPGQNFSRGELCEMIYRYMETPYTGEIEYGVATYYGYSWDGANTASGQPLQTYGYQAAHKTLPFGTVVRVTNLDNNLSVDVEIVDRGPYGEGRVIDLTPVAFEQIGALSAGVLRTRVEVLSQ